MGSYSQHPKDLSQTHTLGFQVSPVCWSHCQQLLVLAASPRVAVRVSPDVHPQPDVMRDGRRAEPPPVRVLQGEVALMTGWVVLWIVACPHLRATCKTAVKMS